MGDQGSGGHAPDAMDEREGFSRRGFLVGAAGLTGVALSGVWRGAPAHAAEGEASATDGPTGGYRFLQLESTIVGSLKSCDDPTAVGIVEPDPPGGGLVTKKHIGNVKYDDFNVQLGLSMGKPMYQWIKASFDHKALRKDGAIVACDFDRNVKSSREFQQALIPELGVPACDGAAQDPAYMTLKVAPEITRHKVGDGSTVSSPPSNQKTWLPANFRLKLGTLPCAKVSKIDSFTVKQNVVESTDGQGRFKLEPTSLEYPNLAVTLPEDQAWYDWHEDFVIKGNNGDDKELSGAIEFLSLDLSKVLARVSLEHVGVFAINPVLREPNPSGIRRVKVELYVEEMKFEYKPAT